MRKGDAPLKSNNLRCFAFIPTSRDFGKTHANEFATSLTPYSTIGRMSSEKLPPGSANKFRQSHTATANSVLDFSYAAANKLV